MGAEGGVYLSMASKRYSVLITGRYAMPFSQSNMMWSREGGREGGLRKVSGIME
jgi:hypothetical protein